jgi:hypothetical protein
LIHLPPPAGIHEQIGQRDVQMIVMELFMEMKWSLPHARLTVGSNQCALGVAEPSWSLRVSVSLFGKKCTGNNIGEQAAEIIALIKERHSLKLKTILSTQLSKPRKKKNQMNTTINHRKVEQLSKKSIFIHTQKLMESFSTKNTTPLPSTACLCPHFETKK